MRHNRVTLLIFGARTYLGREVARFGRAMGHRIVASVDGALPRMEAPWMHGIHWMTDTDPLIADWPDGPPRAIIYCDTTLHGPRHRFRWVLADRPRQLIDRAGEIEPTPRFVLRSTVDQPLLPSAFTTESRRAERLVADSPLEAAILRLPILYGPDRPDSVAAMTVAEALRRIPLQSVTGNIPATMRVETAALAALRAALEPDVTGILEPSEIAQVGDVMIPQ